MLHVLPKYQIVGSSHFGIALRDIQPSLLVDLSRQSGRGALLSLNLVQLASSHGEKVAKTLSLFAMRALHSPAHGIDMAFAKHSNKPENVRIELSIAPQIAVSGDRLSGTLR